MYKCQTIGGINKDKAKMRFATLGLAIKEGLRIQENQKAQGWDKWVVAAYLCECGEFHHASKVSEHHQVVVIGGISIERGQGVAKILVQARVADLVAEINARHKG